MSLPLSGEEIERRTPVWSALAELFLDTEFDEMHVRYMVPVLLASGYDIEALERILRDEVAPTFGPNLLSIAGEWAGWTEEEARELVLGRMTARSGFRGLFGRAMRDFFFGLVAKDWRRVRIEVIGRALEVNDQRGNS